MVLYPNTHSKAGAAEVSRPSEMNLEPIVRWLADPTMRMWYIGFCMFVMVAPMVLLSIWYHRGIRRTRGGRALMRRQNSMIDGGGDTLDMARDISAERYGLGVKELQAIAYWVVAIWILTCILAFGFLFIADEMNKTLGP